MPKAIPLFSEPRFQKESLTRAQYRRAFFGDGGENCEMCGKALHGKCQVDHLLHVSQFPELELDPKNQAATCGCGGKLDFFEGIIGRPNVVRRIEIIIGSLLKPRSFWVIEAAKKRLKPDEYERLKKAA